MLFKWLLFIILFWLVFRAAGNLLRAMSGASGVQRPQQPIEQDGVHVGRKPGARPVSEQRPSEAHVEDARFRDL